MPLYNALYRLCFQKTSTLVQMHKENLGTDMLRRRITRWRKVISVKTVFIYKEYQTSVSLNKTKVKQQKSTSLPSSLSSLSSHSEFSMSSRVLRQTSHPPAFANSPVLFPMWILVHIHVYLFWNLIISLSFRSKKLLF